MKTRPSALFIKAGRLDRRHLQLLMLLISIILFVLGAGAPGDWGGVGG